LHAVERDSWHHLVSGDESWFFWMHHQVACGFCREMTWSQSQDPIFKIKIHVYDYVKSAWLLCCRQTPKWY
jgi:hypothetical protein